MILVRHISRESLIVGDTYYIIQTIHPPIEHTEISQYDSHSCLLYYGQPYEKHECKEIA